MRGVPAIAFEYHASRLLVAATVLLALLAIFAASITGAPHWMRLVMMLCVAALAGASLARLLRPRVRSLLWRSDGGVDLALLDTLTDGRREAQGTVQDARVMGPLIVLRLRWPPRERASLWLLPDNLDADTRRRLRMRLGAHGGGLASGNADSG